MESQILKLNELKCWTTVWTKETNHAWDPFFLSVSYKLCWKSRMVIYWMKATKSVQTYILDMIICRPKPSEFRERWISRLINCHPFALSPKSVVIKQWFSRFWIQVFDFELSAEDMKVIESFNIPFRVCVPMIEVSEVPVMMNSFLTDPTQEAFQGVVWCCFVALLRLCLLPVWLKTNGTVAKERKGS